MDHGDPTSYNVTFHSRPFGFEAGLAEHGPKRAVVTKVRDAGNGGAHELGVTEGSAITHIHGIPYSRYQPEDIVSMINGRPRLPITLGFNRDGTTAPRAPKVAPAQAPNTPSAHTPRGEPARRASLERDHSEEEKDSQVKTWTCADPWDAGCTRNNDNANQTCDGCGGERQWKSEYVKPKPAQPAQRSVKEVYAEQERIMSNQDWTPAEKRRRVNELWDNTMHM